MRLLLLLIPLVGCTSPTLELVADAAIGDGTAGSPGPLAVGRTSWRARVRIVESSRVEVHAPVDADGALLGGPYPPVVFVNGGLVPQARYRWWAEHIASRGYVVLTATHPADLGIFAQGTSTEALQRLRSAAEDPDHALSGAVDPSVPAAVAGHSLGGVVAARTYVGAPDDFATLGIIASFPAGWDDLSDRAGQPVLSIVGENDGSADLTKVEAAILAAPEPRLYAVVDGLNHYDWADEVSQDELDRDGERGRPVPEARQDAMRVIDTWLDAWMKQDDAALDAWNDADFPGVEETR